MDEFAFIAKYLTGLSGPQALDLKDDAAVWTPPQGMDMVMSMDSIVEGVHFPSGKFDEQIAQKLLRINISDLVAKGAKPTGYFLSLSLPKRIGEPELAKFCHGLALDQDKYDLQLWGGDTTRCQGECVLSITIIGVVPTGKAVLRSGAKVGDIVCVSGTIGDAYLGLETVFERIGKSEFSPYLENAYHLPNPPFDMRKTIQEYAHAAIDVSDGLIADAQHIAQASSVGIEINIWDVSLSEAAKLWVSGQNDSIARLALLTNGDDYQTLMTMTESNYLTVLYEGHKLTRIGKVVARTGVKCLDNNGTEIPIAKTGYTHF